MSETKYISVIHVPTDKIVTAFKFEHDATWVGREKDELIATANYCEPGYKVKMIFVKSFIKGNGKYVHAYFRSAPNQVGLIENLSGESNNHKKAKENVYEGIFSGEIKINGEVLDKQKIDDIYIEYRTSKNGYVIPDVLIKFKEEHIKYGYGIFIEVQLSKQNDEETLIRTYFRVIEGFSGTWLWKDNFDKDMNLLDNDLKIKSHRELLSELNENIENNFINRINNYGKIIDKKIDDGKMELWNTLISYIGSFRKEVKNISYNKTIELISIKNEIQKLYELKNDINLNYIKQDLNEIKIKYFNEFKKEVNNEFINSWADAKLKCKLEFKKVLDENSHRFNRHCPICNKLMKIGKTMGGYNWYCPDFPKCNGLIKDVNFKDEG